MLTLDHIKGDGSVHRRQLAKDLKYRVGTAPVIYYALVKAGFPSGYQVLCYNCNISKHRNGNVCAHKIRKKVQRLGRKPVGPKRARNAEGPRK